MTASEPGDTPEHASSETAAGDPVVVEIRRAILAGDILPGERLVEAELAERFGVSRAATRTALLALEGEGIVERLRHRGARVRVVDREEAVELIEVRMSLEGLCAARAAERITDDELAELREIGECMRRCVEADDDVSYSELNRALHQRILEISGHRVARELVRTVRGRSMITHRYRVITNPRRRVQSLREHLDLVEALGRRDGDAAESAMRRHLAGVRDTLRPRHAAAPE